MNNWLSGIIGQGVAHSIGACGTYSSAQQQAQQQAMAAQQAYGLGQNMSQAYTGTNWEPPKWMFDGKILSVIDFANSIWPDDCADKTHFILKWSV